MKRSLQSKKFFAYYMLTISLSIHLPSMCYAQSHPVTHDRLPMRPNTISVIGILNKIDSGSAKLKIIQVVAQGAGIVNALSPGDEIIVKLNRDTKNLVDVKVEGYLKEEPEPDAAKSRYTLIDTPVKLK